MAASVPILYRFDRWDERIGMLRVTGELVHTEELNGEDTLEFTWRSGQRRRLPDPRPTAPHLRCDRPRTASACVACAQRPAAE